MIEGCFSQPDQVESGVPQGTVLGPLLFLCYINDLPNVLDPHTAVRLFADDLLMYRSIKSQDDQVKLQRDLHALGSWGERWGMKFNTKKCNIMLINNQGRPRFYELCNDVLGIVQSAKYLGVTISDDLSWTPHISSIVTKAHQRLGFIRRNLRGSPYAYRAIAYKSLVRSQLEYCCTIWDTDKKSDINSIERVQRKSARWAKGMYGECSVTQLLRELRWEDLADRRRDYRLTLFYKILTKPPLLSISSKEIGISEANRPAREPFNRLKLDRPRASRKSSPLWSSTTFRTVPQWNSLRPANIAEADSPLAFKSQLASANP